MTPAAPDPDDRYARGMKVRRAVLGDAHVDRTTSAATAVDIDFQRFITETAWGAVWSRPGLDLRNRHLVTIAMLAALGREHELAMHLRSIRHTGVTLDEVREIFLHVAIYAGVPAANAAFSIAKSVFDPPAHA